MRVTVARFHANHRNFSKYESSVQSHATKSSLNGTSRTSSHKKDDWGKSHDLHTIFAKLIALSDEDVSRILTFVVSETLACDSAMVEILGNMFNVNMADHWQVEDTATQCVFFDLLRDKQAINAMLDEIGGKTTAHGNITATAKVQKQIIRDYLDGTRKGGKPDWQPRYMDFPMQAYTDKGGIGVLDKWNGVKQNFTA